MKKFLLIALAFVPLLSMAQDDTYFVPKKKAAKTTASVGTYSTQTAVKPAELAVYNNNSRSDDDYNRRFNYNAGNTGSDDWQTGGGSEVADTLAQDTLRGAGYSREMDDAEDDYYYSRRLLRFHSPRLVAYRSPYYWDLVYGYGCYDYIDYWYGDPFYWNYGWGYGWSWGPWSCWYGPIWGWHSPYAYDYWGWGWHSHCYGYTYWGGGYIPRHSNPRTQGIARYDRNSFGNRSSALNGRTTRTSALAGRSSRTAGTRSSYAEGRGSRTGTRAGSDYASRSGVRVGSYGASNVTSVGRSSSRSAYGATAAQATRSSVTRVNENRNSSYSTRSSATTSRTSTYTPTTSRSASSTPSYTPSRSSSVGSFGGGGGSFGGGSRGGGSFGGGGGARSGGGRR